MWQKTWTLIRKCLTQSPAFFNTSNSDLRLSPPITVAWVHVTLQHTYWLTFVHIGNCHDVPLIKVSVEGWSIPKRYRKKRRTITFTVNAIEKTAQEPLPKYCGSPKKANKIHTSAQRKDSTSRHPQTYVSSNIRILKHTYPQTYVSSNYYANPSVSQRTRTCTNHHPTFIHPPPTNHPTCIDKTTHRLISHRVHWIYRILHHPTLHHPYITPSKRKFCKKKSHNGKRRMKSTCHEISWGERAWNLIRAWNCIRKSHNGQKAWNIIRTSHKNITVSHKPHTLLQWTTGVHSICRILQYHLSTIFTSHHHHHHQPHPPTQPSNHNSIEFTSRQAIPNYMYWLTICHIGNFCDVPLIEVSVEGGSLIKHCRKKRRSISFTVNA